MNQPMDVLVSEPATISASPKWRHPLSTTQPELSIVLDPWAPSRKSDVDRSVSNHLSEDSSELGYTDELRINRSCEQDSGVCSLRLLTGWLEGLSFDDVSTVINMSGTSCVKYYTVIQN